jgi:hypothetical protein
LTCIALARRPLWYNVMRVGSNCDGNISPWNFVDESDFSVRCPALKVHGIFEKTHSLL